MKNKKPSAESLKNFDALMRGLVAVPRKELDKPKPKPSQSVRRK
jgi:hypothetical protein